MSNLIESGQNLIKRGRKVAVPIVAGLGIATAVDSVNAGRQNLPPATQDSSHTLFIETPDIFLKSGIEFQDPTPIPEAIEIITTEGLLSEIPTLNFQDFASDTRFDSTFASINEVNVLFSKFIEEQGLIVNSFRIVVAGALSGSEIIPTPTPESNQEDILYYSYEGGGVLANKINGEWKLYSQRNIDLAQAVGLIQHNELQGSEMIASNWYIVPDKENLRLIAYDRAHPELGIMATSVNTAYNEAIWIPRVVFENENFAPIQENYQSVLETFVSTVSQPVVERNTLEDKTPDEVKNDPSVQAPTGEMLNGYFKIENGQILVWRPNLSPENSRDLNTNVEEGWVVVEDAFTTRATTHEQGITWLFERRLVDITNVEASFNEFYKNALQEITLQIYSDAAYDGLTVHLTQIAQYSPEDASQLFLTTMQSDFDQLPFLAVKSRGIANHFIYTFYSRQYTETEIQTSSNQGLSPTINIRPDQNLIEVLNEDSIDIGLTYVLFIMLTQRYNYSAAEAFSLSASYPVERDIIYSYLHKKTFANGVLDFSQVQPFIDLTISN